MQYNQSKQTMQILLLVVFCFIIGSAQAFTPKPDPPGMLAIGLTNTQSAIVTVLVPPSPIVPPNPIHVTLAIFDSAGTQLKTLQTEILRGQIVSLTLAGGSLGLRAGQRYQVYGVVQCTGSIAQRTVCAQNIVSGMELFDTETGETDVVTSISPTILPTVN